MSSDVQLDGENVILVGNVGIGTDPGLRLDVAGRIRLREGAGGSAGICLYQTKTAQDQAFVGMLNDGHLGFFGQPYGWGLVMDCATGNVGVGTLTPAYRLDVADRVRLREGSGTAGVWLYQSKPAKDQAFVGMASDTLVGLYGATAGWGLVMDVATGNVGIGTGNVAHPKAALQVNGMLLATMTDSVDPVKGESIRVTPNSILVGTFVNDTNATWDLLKTVKTLMQEVADLTKRLSALEKNKP